MRFVQHVAHGVRVVLRSKTVSDNAHYRITPNEAACTQSSPKGTRPNAGRAGESSEGGAFAFLLQKP